MWRYAASACIILTFSLPLHAADWPAFRGPDRNGISSDASAPLSWAPDRNIKWKVPLPMPGNSSPIVSRGRVFLACAEDPQGTRRSLYCFSREDGRQLWVRTIPYDRIDPTHQTNPYCASTPAADGERVVVWHGGAGIHCYDYDGQLLWSRDLGTHRHIWGYASSPIFHRDSVLLNFGPGDRTFLIALDKRTGNTLWQTDEPGGADDKSPETNSWIGSWSTPTVITIDGREQVLLHMPRRVNAYDPATGRILWFCQGVGDLAYTDLQISKDNDIAVATGGFHGPAIGFSLPAGPSGDITDTNRLWRMTEPRNPQRIGTGVIIGQHLYIASEPAIQCIDITNGQLIWQHRIPGHTFWSPITATPGRLYITSQKGTTFVIAPNPGEFTLLQTNELDEQSNSTIAVSDGQIFVRTFKHLYCIEHAGSPSGK